MTPSWLRQEKKEVGRKVKSVKHWVPEGVKQTQVESRDSQALIILH